MAPPHASEGGTLQSIPHYAPYELRGRGLPRISIPSVAVATQLLRRMCSHGLKARACTQAWLSAKEGKMVSIDVKIAFGSIAFQRKDIDK